MITDKQIKAIKHMVACIKKNVSCTEWSPDMPQLWKCDFKHIQYLINTNKIQNLHSHGYRIERIFAFLSDSINNIADHYDEDMEASKLGAD